MANEHDCFIPFEPDDWLLTQKWIINRTLFLLNLREYNHERFCGGYAETLEELNETMKRSFYRELYEIKRRHYALYAKAKEIFTNDYLDENPEISYLGG